MNQMNKADPFHYNKTVDYKCRALHCRHADTHITNAHTCGVCKRTGHGHNECGNAKLIKGLYNNEHIQRRMFSEPQEPHKIEEMPKHLQCTHKLCVQKKSHSLSAHQPRFEKDPLLNYFDDICDKIEKLMVGKPGCFSQAYYGMGNIYFCRNVGITINTSIHTNMPAPALVIDRIELASIDCSQTKEIEEFTKGLKEVPFDYDL